MTASAVAEVDPVVFRPPRGVQIQPPPEEFIPSITASIDAALSSIPADRHVAFFAVADLSGANVAVVKRFGAHWSAVAWFGKSWEGPTSAGVKLIGSY